MDLTGTEIVDVNSASGPKIKKLCAFPPHKNCTCENPCKENADGLLVESEAGTSQSQNSSWTSLHENKALTNSLILKGVFEYLTTSDLMNCRLVNLCWSDESTRLLLEKRALITRSGHVQKVLKRTKDSTDATNFQLVDFKEILEKSQHFPSTHIVINLSTLGSLGSGIPRELQGFLTRHAQKFDELTITCNNNNGEEIGNLAIDWKVLSSLILYRIPHIETLHIEVHHPLLERDNPLSTQNNNSDDKNVKRKRKRQFNSPVLPNLKTVTFRSFYGLWADFFLEKIIESAPNLEEVGLTKFRNKYPENPVLWNFYAVQLYRLLNRLNCLHLIKYHIFIDGDFISPFRFVNEKMKLESLSFETTFHCPNYSAFYLLSHVLMSSKNTLKSIQKLPFYFFATLLIPDCFANLEELYINDGFAPIHFLLEPNELQWIHFFPQLLACRLRTTFPNLKKVTIDFKLESYQYWEDSCSTSWNSSKSSLPTVTDVTLTNEPPPQFSSRLQRLSELFPNVEKLKIGNVCHFPSSAEFIWTHFTKLTSLELTIDAERALRHGTNSMDFAFIGKNGTEESVSILNLKDLRVLKLNFFDSSETARFSDNYNALILLSSWAAENTFRLMTHLKRHFSLSCELLIFSAGKLHLSLCDPTPIHFHDLLYPQKDV